MMRAPTVAVAIVVGWSGLARADQYEASVAIQPQGGLAWVREDGAGSAAQVFGGGAAVRVGYGMRDWLAIDAELGGIALGAATFEDVPVSIGGAPSRPETITRTTRGARVLAGASLRLGVAWVPTFSVGVGAQLRMRGDATVTSTDLVPVGREGEIAFDPLVAVRAGLDRRLNARWIVGVSIGAGRAFAGPAIDTVDVNIAVSRYWYPNW